MRSIYLALFLTASVASASTLEFGEFVDCSVKVSPDAAEPILKYDPAVEYFVGSKAGFNFAVVPMKEDGIIKASVTISKDDIGFETVTAAIPVATDPYSSGFLANAKVNGQSVSVFCKAKSPTQ